MKVSHIVAALTVLVIVLVLIWYTVSVMTEKNRRRPPPSANFTDIRGDYRSKPSDLWMTDNHDRFTQELRQSRYRYKIFESDGTLIYDNRKGLTTDLRQSVQYMAACSLGEFTLVDKNNNRHMAIRVNDSQSRYRIIHITGPGIHQVRY